ncbi:MAG: type II toxin-antitoxin system RelE/ParE family toxin [Acidobacteria bacterium]|nr:type II toxin-antitoxin system RelE/ParE family toxin [Acidobacteriota bacterium]
MKKHTVRFSTQAENDLHDAFWWGVENWGPNEAETWLDEIELKAVVALSQKPLAFPVAPESAEFEQEIRQMVFGRYRILFCLAGKEVLILRIRGPFSGKSLDAP